MHEQHEVFGRVIGGAVGGVLGFITWHSLIDVAIMSVIGATFSAVAGFFATKALQWFWKKYVERKEPIDKTPKP